MAINKLKNKRILYLGIEFYNYHKEIIKTLEYYKALVKFYPVVKYGNVYTFLNLISKNLLQKYLKNYGDKIIHRIHDDSFDYVFVIQGFQQDEWFYKELKKKLPKALFIMYHWDSLKKHDYLNLIKYFDRIFSFDYQDAAQHTVINYLPLFYINSYNVTRFKNEYFKYDLLFVGKLKNHFKRYEYVENLRKYATENKLNVYIHLYTDYKFFLKMLLKGKLLRNVKFNTLSSEETKNLFDMSNAIVDFHDPDQTGITMRSIEALGSCKKLITINKTILFEPIYSPNNVFIINPRNESFLKEFLNIPYQEMLVREKYSINTWILTIFCNNDK
ncbi:hypothetical protein [Roseimarinus sediminis]|uniref:hypothetical protein n=1 Tax=Roseimarinus sediminis TaxID=1610899 RepID=UPI003D1AF60D